MEEGLASSSTVHFWDFLEGETKEFGNEEQYENKLKWLFLSNLLLGLGCT